MTKQYGRFVWDEGKERANIIKHGVDFVSASRAFLDPKRGIYTDAKYSSQEERLFCVGRVECRVLTVRFTYRAGCVRIIGAGCWRKGVKLYEKERGG
jgi:uncharacterized protein